jgi:hypothetical protein
VSPLLRRLTFVALVLGLLPGESSALRITELMASNSASIQDDDGEFSDWLELFNETGASVNLDGLFLTDDELVPTKWRLPAVSLGAGQYMLVWASDKNRAVPGQPLHTNFRLSAAGEYLGIVAANGTTVLHEYNPSFEAVAENRTYGLAADLTTKRCFTIATPGAANNESGVCQTTAPVAFAPERGFYDAPFQLTISTPTPGATIRFTLDGSDPTPAHGTIYTAPIDVTTTAMVRAMAYGAGLDPTPTVTHTYIFLADILTQSIDDQPEEYLFASADYDVDPTVVNDPRYADEIIDDLKAIPTMSIVTDVDHLFGPANGIYTHRSGEGVAWERPTSVELIHASGAEGFQINCGVRIQGGVSRLSDSGKYNLRLLFKGIYGPSKLEYPLFPGSRVDVFDTVILTATHGYSWHAGYADAEYIRDTWLKDTQLAMGQVSSHSTYVHLYINGRYWGLYRPTERPSAPFLASWFGGIEEDYDALNSGQPVDGDRVAWEELQARARGPVDTLAGYEAVREYLDVESFADYMISNIFAGNYDWPDKNWYAGRRREPGAGFHFFNWDGEMTLMSVSGNRIAVGAYDTPGALWALLREGSPEFRLVVADRIQKHFFNGGAMTPEATGARWRARRDEIYQAIVGESARWGDGRRGQNPYTRDVEWTIENQRLLLSYFPARSRVQFEQFRKAGLFPPIDAPVLSQHGGEFFPGLEVSIATASGTIHYTTDGSDPRVPGGAVSPAASAYSSPIALSTGTTIRARALSAGTWSALAEATFSPVSPLRITELLYNPVGGVGAEFLEIRNIGASPVDLAGVALTSGVTFPFPSHVLAAGGHALVVENTATFASLYGGGHPVVGQYSGRLDNGGERIVLAAADASTIHDFEYDDAWYPSTDGPGKSLVIRDAAGDLALWGQAAGWRASTASSGTPGAVEPKLCANGVDDDGDAAIDLADGGCANAASDTETTECSDGLDNDGDTQVDLTDLQCTSASHASESPDAGDSFFCYAAAATTEFERTTLVVGDELDGNVGYEVRRPSSICLVGTRDAIAPIDPATHLRAYEIRTIPGEPEHVPVLGARYENVLGKVFIDVAAPGRLLVPASVDLAAPVAAPDFEAHGVDYYKCYRAKMTRSEPKFFPTNAQIHFEDAIEDRDYLLRPPTRVCLPASVGGSAIKTPGRHLLCYKAGRGRYMAKHAARTGVHTADVVATTQVDTRREEEVCIPAVPVVE